MSSDDSSPPSLFAMLTSWEALWWTLTLVGPLMWTPLSNFLANRWKERRSTRNQLRRRQSGILRGGRFSRDLPNVETDDDDDVVDREPTSWMYPVIFTIGRWLLRIVRVLLRVVFQILRQGSSWLVAAVRQRLAAGRKSAEEPTSRVSFSEHSDGTVKTTRHTFDPSAAPTNRHDQRTYVSTTPRARPSSSGSRPQTPTRTTTTPPTAGTGRKVHTPPPPRHQWKQDISLSPKGSQEEEMQQQPPARHGSILAYQRSPFLSVSTRALAVHPSPPLSFSEQYALHQKKQKKRQEAITARQRQPKRSLPSSTTVADNAGKRQKQQTTTSPSVGRIPLRASSSTSSSRAFGTRLKRSHDPEHDAWILREFSQKRVKATPENDENATPNAAPTMPSVSFGATPASQDGAKTSGRPVSVLRRTTKTPAGPSQPATAVGAPTTTTSAPSTTETATAKSKPAFTFGGEGTTTAAHTVPAVSFEKPSELNESTTRAAAGPAPLSQASPSQQQPKSTAAASPVVTFGTMPPSSAAPSNAAATFLNSGQAQVYASTTAQPAAKFGESLSQSTSSAASLNPTPALTFNGAQAGATATSAPTHPDTPLPASKFGAPSSQTSTSSAAPGPAAPILFKASATAKSTPTQTPAAPTETAPPAHRFSASSSQNSAAAAPSPAAAFPFDVPQVSATAKSTVTQAPAFPGEEAHPAVQFCSSSSQNSFGAAHGPAAAFAVNGPQTGATATSISTQAQAAPAEAAQPAFKFDAPSSQNSAAAAHGPAAASGKFTPTQAPGAPAEAAQLAFKFGASSSQNSAAAAPGPAAAFGFNVPQAGATATSKQSTSSVQLPAFHSTATAPTSLTPTTPTQPDALPQSTPTPPAATVFGKTPSPAQPPIQFGTPGSTSPGIAAFTSGAPALPSFGAPAAGGVPPLPRAGGKDRQRRRRNLLKHRRAAG